MISHQYKCIFIHIPKCAGTSIEKALGHKGKQDHRPLDKLTGLIATLRSIRWGYKPVSKRAFRNYFKFAFVRNPWARVYSLYNGVMLDEYTKKKDGIVDCSFEEFLYKYCHRTALRPQGYYLGDKMDFIGKFENLREDFAKVCEILGIDVELPHLLNRKTRYVDHYNDSLRQFVAVRYADEIERFGYTFENGLTN